MQLQKGRVARPLARPPAGRPLSLTREAEATSSAASASRVSDSSDDEPVVTKEVNPAEWYKDKSITDTAIDLASGDDESTTSRGAAATAATAAAASALRRRPCECDLV